jgi:site-specific DNA recombinase
LRPCATWPRKGSWNEILRLLEDPALIQAEIGRRREAAQRTDPLKHREDAWRRDDVRLATNIDRLVTAYQEGLMTLEQLRGRVPELRKRRQGIQAELQSLAAAATNETLYLRLIETLADFRTRLRERAETLNTVERQKVLPEARQHSPAPPLVCDPPARGRV